MDRNVTLIALAGMICGTVMFVSLVSAWLRRRSDPAPRDSFRNIEARLGEMQQAIDSIAVEVERVSEGQRFATKLLSERAERASAGADMGAEVARSR
jgi:hypothetical protein